MQTYRIVRFSQSGRRRTTIEPGDLATPHVFKRWGRIFIASNHFGPITPDREFYSGGRSMATIDLTPTPEGLRQSIQRFEEQIAKSEHLIKVAEEWMELTDTERRVYVAPSEFAIFEAALEALQEQERQRIEHMREGIAAATEEPGKPPAVPADSWFIDAAVPGLHR